MRLLKFSRLGGVLSFSLEGRAVGVMVFEVTRFLLHEL